MSDVTKVVGGVAIGPPANSVTVTKIVGFVIYDTLSQSTPTASVRKKVTVRARLIPGA